MIRFIGIWNYQFIGENMNKLKEIARALNQRNIEKMVDFAKNAGYDGVEIRVDLGHKHTYQ